MLGLGNADSAGEGYEKVEGCLEILACDVLTRSDWLSALTTLKDLGRSLLLYGEAPLPELGLLEATGEVAQFCDIVDTDLLTPSCIGLCWLAGRFEGGLMGSVVRVGGAD